MLEVLNTQSNGIIRGPEDLPSGVSYEQLVETVGGKAAGLLWIKKNIPDLPMARMIIAVEGTSHKAIAQAVNENGLKPPYIIRPSTSVDNLPGFEGEFPTKIISKEHASQFWVAQTIYSVQQMGGESSLHDKYPFHPSVIVAELDNSDFNGTLVQHPHDPDVLLANVTRQYDKDQRCHAFYYMSQGEVIRVDSLSRFEHTEVIPSYIDEQVDLMGRFYREITQIPDFSNGNMTYQLEFGPETMNIHQIRDFLPKQPTKYFFPMNAVENINKKPIVFGTTPPEGLVVEVWKHDSTSEIDIDSCDKTTDLPLMVVADATRIKHVQFPRTVNFLLGEGLFAHEDIRAMRTTPITIMNTSDSYCLNSLEDSWEYLQSGQVVRIFSDGNQVKIEAV